MPLLVDSEVFNVMVFICCFNALFFGIFMLFIVKGCFMCFYMLFLVELGYLCVVYVLLMCCSGVVHVLFECCLCNLFWLQYYLTSTILFPYKIQSNLNHFSNNCYYTVNDVNPPASPVSELRLGKMHLVDLAGSERVALSGAEGDTLLETQSINLSLTAIGRLKLIESIFFSSHHYQ